MINKIRGALFGLAIGDALGVPVEFKSRDYLKTTPITNMIGYGSWNQPPGTWSDDSSLAFCLTESLVGGYDLNNIGGKFIDWLNDGYWGAHNKVFDVGNTTRRSITRLIKGVSPEFSGDMMEEDNGNGSLMRIMPLLFQLKELPIEERFTKIKEVSSITHAHFRSVFACFIYLEMALQILNGSVAEEAYSKMKTVVKEFSVKNEFNKNELNLFNRLLESEIKIADESSIHSDGYVLNTLEASIWCLLNTDNYADGVIKAVNLGGDTDTTACVSGGLAGLLYGYEAIPREWVIGVARSNDINNLCERLNKSLNK